jgi:methylamine utilization protein MauE
MSSTILVCVISWLLAGVFAQACWHKLAAWPRFRASFVAYRIVPENLVTLTGRLLTVVELLVVVGLVFLQIPALWVAVGLLVVYATGISINVLRGRQLIDCGCGDEPTPVSWLLVARNLLLVGLSMLAIGVAADGVELTWQYAGVGLGLSLIAFGLYSVIEQLLANRGRHQRLWLGVA